MRRPQTLSILLFLVLLGGPIAGREASWELEQGVAALGEQRWTDAEMSFRRAIQVHPGSADAHTGLARAVAGGGDPTSAVRGLSDKARSWLLAGRYVDAERLLEVANELRPDSPEVLVLLGRSRILQRRHLAAQEPLARAYELGSVELDGMLHYGATLWENGDVERAEAILRQAVAQAPSSLPALYQLGRLLLWQGRFEEASELLERCARLAPQAPDIHLDLARALGGAEKGEALDAYRRALALAPEHSELRYGFAMALLHSGDRGAAETELARYRQLYEAEQRATREQGLAAARVARGRELVTLGRFEEALAHLRDLPESADSLAAVATALQAQGDLAGAVRELSRAAALAPDRDDLRARLNDLRLEELRKR